MNSEQNRRRETARTLLHRIADRVDLAIDIVTLGQYGLERAPDTTADCTGSSRRVIHDAGSRLPRHRGSCDRAGAITWDWPRSRGNAVPR